MHKYPLPKSAPGDPGPQDHARGWLGHVQAGRIASHPGTTSAQLLRHWRNEQVLLGRGGR